MREGSEDRKKANVIESLWLEETFKIIESSH